MQRSDHIKCWNNAWSTTLKDCVLFMNHLLLWSTFLFIQSHILYYKSRYTHYIVFQYVRKWNMKKSNKIKLTNKIFQIAQIQYPPQVMKKWDTLVIQSMTTVWVMNIDQYKWKLHVLYVKCLCKDQAFCLMWTCHYVEGIL